MCGIAGVLDPTVATGPEELSSLTSAMVETIVHRGPDDGGVWVDPASGIALGNRRLAILDQSPAGHQPMMSRSRRYVLVFNGEIYNHRHLRDLLETAGHRFRGRSDTEVLLAAVEEWGLSNALQRSNGMFAVALWDSHERTLQLARDRVGEKPLYYGWAGSHLVFGSELKALRAHPRLDTDIDEGALYLYLRWAYVPSPHCIYGRVRKVAPGTIVSIGPGASPDRLPTAVPFWRLADVVERGADDPFTGGPGGAIEQLEALLIDAVRLRLDSDVPIGAFLSGGVDSSTVVALMAIAGASQPVRTFTITMPEAGLDEGPEAQAVANYLGTEHHSVELAPSDALDAVPELASVYDEPFGDPSQLPTLLLSRTARRDVTVVLSGDGGDEVFGGYNRHVHSNYAWQRTRLVPRPLRKLGAQAILALSPRALDSLLDPSRWWIPKALRVRNPGDKAHKLASVLAADNAMDVYPALAGLWDGALPLAENAVEPATAADLTACPSALGMTEQMMFLDTMMALPDGMLTKVDRATMAVSLEARVPILDHRVVEFAWSLPLDLKIVDHRGKWILRQVLQRYVPRQLTDRPKLGFDPPVGTWLRGPLRPWAEELLQVGRLSDDGWLDAERVRRRWAEHLSGTRNWDHEMWAVLMLQSWFHKV